MMLETDGVDDDYFTPLASTSLANIFGTSSKKFEVKENESLKYTPPKQQTATQNPDDSKVTECIFATALVGYEWVDNVYSCRGNLGFAILKILKTGLHNIILYDSKKTSLSSTTITPTFEVTINNNQSICYYDNMRKYWSLYVNEDGMNSIISLLKSFNVLIKHSSHTDNNPLDSNVDIKKINTEEKLKKEIGSDTDSSTNRKTKTSILNRMATMGHSVLPTNTNVKQDSSDSSDTSENVTHIKTLRHKPVKNALKKFNTEKNAVRSTSQKIYEDEQNQVALNTDKMCEKPSLYTYVNGVLVPVTSTNIISNTIDKNINNMDLFVTEQRMNNTEMRINVNRITDKIDNILLKLNNLEEKDTSGGSTINLQTTVYQKLLTEYENKIKMYEELLKIKDFKTKKASNENDAIYSEMEGTIQTLKMDIVDLQQQNQEKANEISQLNNELILLQQRFSNYSPVNETIDMANIIKNLENDLLNKDSQLKDLTKKYENSLHSNSETVVEEKLKTIMNNTYQTISGNFENNESYSGEAIKKIIGVVIRNITLNSLNMLNSNQTNS